ncbi:MAG: hypothetical protein ACFCBU_14130 [Cyanophyceae cyanobacterium]
MVSLNADELKNLGRSLCDKSGKNEHLEDRDVQEQHQYWSTKSGWKTTLNNLRLMIEPMVMLCLISP